MRRSWQDRFKSVFGHFPYRCQMCSVRFTGPMDPEGIAKHNVATEAALREREEDARELEEQERERKEEEAREDDSHGSDKK